MHTHMQQFAVSEFVAGWIAAWNAHDLDALMAHYHPDATFISPRAAVLTGDATVHGRDALRRYWAAAIARTTHRRFTLESVVWDEAARRLVILYRSEVDGRAVRAAESFTFDADHRVIAGEALFGAEVPAPDGL